MASTKRDRDRSSISLPAARFLLVLLLNAEVIFAASYRSTNWRSEEGLPQNTIQALHQDQNGYLWIATRFGLARFDGVQFATYSLRTHPEMMNDNCIFLSEAPDASLWIGTENGLLHLQNGKFRRYTVEDGLPEKKYLSLYVTRKGEVWVGSYNSLSLLQPDGRFMTLQLPLEREVRTINEDPDGHLLLGSSAGVQRFRLPARELELDMLLTKPAKTILITQAGDLWAAGEEGVASRIGSTVQDYTTANGLVSNYVVDLAEEPGYGIWVATEAPSNLPGLQVLRPNGSIELVSELAHIRTAAVRVDSEGNLWVGSTYNGLFRLQRRAFFNYTTEDGLQNDFIWSVCESQDGAIWVGTQSGISRIVQTNIANFGGADFVTIGLSANQGILSVWPTQDGGVLMAGDYALAKYHSGVFVDLRPLTGGQLSHYSCVYEDGDGSMWFGVQHSLGRLSPQGEHNQYNSNHGLPDASVRAILRDKKGVLWLGTYGGGLARFDWERFDRFTVADGLSNNRVWTLHVDDDNSLWLGTENGLNLYKDGTFHVFQTSHGLFDNLINSIVEDDAGYLWLSCNRGIFRMKKSHLLAIARGDISKASALTFGQAEGMLSSETNGEHAPAGWKSRDGLLWFPTTKGLTRVDPKTIPKNLTPPNVMVEFVATADHVVYGHNPEAPLETLPLKQVGGITYFPPGSARVLEFHYTATSFTAPERVEFRIKLEGYDPDWRNIGRKRVLYYTSLPPGKYNFRVQACNNHGVWNETGASFPFVIKPFFYETAWFAITCAVLVLSTGFVVHHWRLQIVRKIEALQKDKALEQERSRIARDMHDDLGSSLTQIAMLSEVTRQKGGLTPALDQHLRKISERARSLVDSLTELIWTINPQNDSIQHLLSHAREYTASYLGDNAIKYHFRMPGDCPTIIFPSEHRRNTFLVLKEILHNIVKHAKATEVVIAFSLCQQEGAHAHARQFKMLIQDNGIGFDLAAVHDGHGLKNMTARASAMGGRLNVQTQPGKGTTIELVVPCPELQKNVTTAPTTFV